MTAGLVKDTFSSWPEEIGSGWHAFTEHPYPFQNQDDPAGCKKIIFSEYNLLANNFYPKLQ
ncbi:MAG: hypothetical protein ACN6NI_01080 [Acinetobacter sp.]